MKIGLTELPMRCLVSRQSRVVIAGLLCVSLSSCFQIKDALKSDLKKIKKVVGGKPELKSHQYALDEQPAQRGGLSALSGGNIVAKVGQLQTSEDEIIWAPEDPDAPIAEFEGLAVNDAPVDSWYEDYGKALRQARVTGKPVLIWFTRSRNSPLCQVLSREVLSTREFDDWASENVIRLRIDSNIKISDVGERRDREREIAALKKRYSALGQPVVVVVSPRGTEFGKYRGYKVGSSESYFGRLRNAKRAAEEDYVSWKSDLESKGYRVWHDNRGRTVFAKVARYKEGVIWLVEPDGKRSKSAVSKLSTEDQLYIERRKEAARSN